jgi:hypothetical protein
MGVGQLRPTTSVRSLLSVREGRSPVEMSPVLNSLREASEPHPDGEPEVNSEIHHEIHGAASEDFGLPEAADPSELAAYWKGVALEMHSTAQLS